MKMSIGLLIDLDKCDGCGGGDEFACQTACQKSHGLPVSKRDKLTGSNFTITETFVNDVFVRRMCQHCAQPACVSACPVAALQKTELGPVTYNNDKCLGCRYCFIACPFDVPKYEWESTGPRVRKCDLCYERTSKGLPTACAEACQAGATTFGIREDLIAIALKTLKEDKDYVQRIYGLEEVGGTSMLYIGKVPFEQLGFKTNLGYEPLPQKTWNVLSKLPDVLSVGGILMAGVWWITNRRDEVRAQLTVARKK
jgi:formate dehydrogenase iron-sulfur subunit